MKDKRYRTFNQHLKEFFGERIYKIGIDAGFTCPNRNGTKGDTGCIYCYGERTSTTLLDLPAMREQMRLGMQALVRKYKAHKFLAYFQSYTNTYAPVEELARLYRAALEEPYIVGMSVGTRPDCVSEPVLDLLGELAQDSYLWLEFGLQSIHDSILTSLHRGHNFDQFLDAYFRARQRRKIKICVHVILGLPGESNAQMLETAMKLSELAVDGVKIHSAHVVKNTPLANMYERGEYRPMEREEYVNVVCDFLERLSPQIIVHRLVADAPRARFLAPDWCLQKSQSVSAIDEELIRRDSRQGSQLGAARCKSVPLP
ncbi:TIGR01212 family radical SAM protein [candidate division KSB3 bacterium]|uniref:TIGR01212 family radical SAM protein n=1 Tax=candidate division KSB3 bacterium TaxID=2044937 RepID=A0A2G6E5C1_9BACT|nr:MAG: TIGR01212 family radical SAM protein [candidate division KSB3 bacterium]PIE28367.1 MAG: TIGR01212 family radical SAM protein [candidate division KSB3 bacterium]